MNEIASAPLRILIVEDSSDSSQLTALQLEQDGLEAEYQRVNNKADFISALDPTPDLILSDLSLPNFDNLQALPIIQERKLDIPIILFF